MLTRFPLFASLDASQIAGLERQCVRRRYASGAHVLEYAGEGDEVYFLLSGIVRVWLPTTRRTDIILSDIRAGEFFGELAAIDGWPRSARVTALTIVNAACMPAAVFRHALGQYPDVSGQILRLLARRVRMLDVRVEEFSTLSVRDRARAELLRLGRLRTDHPNQAVISPPPTHAEIAARISSHREAVTRELASLERDGLLERRRGALVISNVDALVLSLEGLRAPRERARSAAP